MTDKALDDITISRTQPYNDISTSRSPIFNGRAITEQSARQELFNYRHRQKMLEIIKEKIAMTEMKTVSAKTSQLGNKISAEPAENGAYLSNLINSLLDQRAAYNKEMLEVNQLLIKIEQRIKVLSSNKPLLANILTMYFIQNKKLEQISIDIGYCYRQIRRYLNDGIGEYSKVMLSHNVL